MLHDLDKLYPEDEKIRINKAEFVITANIPRSIIKKHSKIQMGSGVDLNKAVELIDEHQAYLIDVLSVSNNPEYVETEIKKLSDMQVVHLSTFHIKYLLRVYENFAANSNSIIEQKKKS